MILIKMIVLKILNENRKEKKMKLTLDIIAKVYLENLKKDKEYDPIWWRCPEFIKQTESYSLWDFPEDNSQYLCTNEREIILKISPNDGYAKYEFPIDIIVNLNKYYKDELDELGYKIYAKGIIPIVERINKDEKDV